MLSYQLPTRLCLLFRSCATEDGMGEWVERFEVVEYESVVDEW